MLTENKSLVANPPKSGGEDLDRQMQIGSESSRAQMRGVFKILTGLEIELHHTPGEKKKKNFTDNLSFNLRHAHATRSERTGA